MCFRMNTLVIRNLLKINWIYFQNWRNSQSPSSESNQSFLLLLYFEQFEVKLASAMKKFCERNQAAHNLEIREQRIQNQFTLTWTLSSNNDDDATWICMQ